MGEDDAPETDRRRQGYRKPIFPRPLLPVVGYDHALQIVVDDGTGKISLPRTAFLALAKQRCRSVRAATPGARSQTRYSPPPAPASAKGTKIAVCGSFPFRPTTLPSKARPGPGLRVNSGCESTRPSVLDGGRPGLLLLVEGEHERSPGQGRTPGVAVLTENQPGSEMESDVDPIAAVPGLRRQNDPTGRIGLVLHTGHLNLRGRRPARYADLDAKRGRAGGSQA